MFFQANKDYVKLTFHIVTLFCKTLIGITVKIPNYRVLYSGYFLSVANKF